MAAIALLLIGVQMFGRPGVNVLSLRATRQQMLNEMWPRSSTLLQYPSWYSGELEPDTTLVDIAERCGGRLQLSAIVERVSDPQSTLKEAAQSMYRMDIIFAVAETVPWWRIKALQIGFGLGLWSEQLDQPSAYLSQERIDNARESSDWWYQKVTNQITCDATRSMMVGKR
ncbi:hypothetical protein ASE73_11990 [Sphingomonas sp. Leaf24]|uniref:hypothetical protein n=1 Tax=unclassified Sphingomonas TaxID=196159 RepID=UPI00070087EF|nr:MULTISPECIES: hypothetical protein [unclassified Sphingomonas]KQM13171.1 hypothetical protein ASE50_10040 [Sphingomonas sp. Leaf5]KQM85758.1 hypothetical protein ASE73_11990 [Sphingomonas sp. Leaf24]